MLLLFLAPWVNGQELYGEYLDHQQGLLSRECYDIICDEKGYLLISTQYGPVKYDGEKCIPICMNLPIEERVIYDFEKDPKGNIYLLNSKFQILKLQGNKAIRIGPEKVCDTSNNIIFIKLHWAKSGLYILNHQAYLKYSFQSKKIHTYYHESNPGNQRLKFVYHPEWEFPFRKYTHGDYNFKTNNNIGIQFKNSGQKFKFVSKGLPDTREDQVTVGKTDYLLINSILFKKRGNHITHTNLSGILFMEYFYNRIWLCTYNGLLELDAEGNLLQHHFKGDLVAGVAPLKSGGIAISFNRKGVFICSNIHNQIYKNISVSSAARIHPFHLLGTTKGEIYQYDHHRLTKMTHIDSLGYSESIGIPNAIWEINAINRNLLFTSTNGIYCYNRNFQLVRKLTDPRCYYFGLIVDKNNLYPIQRQCIRKVTWKDWSSKSFQQYYFSSKGYTIKHLRCHNRLNDSIILLGTDIGLFYFNLKTNKHARTSFFKKEYAVRSIEKTAAGELVVFSRYHGIYFFKANTLVKRIDPPSVSVMRGWVYKNHLIIQGNDGVFIRNLNQWKLNEWINAFKGETQSVFVLQNSLLISNDKDLIITELEDYKKEQITIILNRVGIGNAKKKHLPAQIAPNSSISLDFDILKFGTDRLDIYYKLISKGENTIDQVIKGTQINFDALKSGNYTLEVYPVINGKIHFEQPKRYRFRIEKTFWESTIFYIGTIILAGSLIFSVLLSVNLSRKRRSAQRSELESKLNEYKLLAVKAQVNPHFLSNGLAAIQALILKGDNDKAAQYLAKFSFLMRKILYYSETQFISLKQELELIDAYLELELLRFRNRFNIQKEIHLSDNQLEKFQFPSLLLQPILENAIWHGLKFQEKDPELLISFQLNENQELVVQIRDNGLGFNTSNKSEEHLSKGNILITERIDTLNQQFQNKVAHIEIISSGNGTNVIFSFTPQLYLFKHV
ncbi:histidine kinase [uncultured Fluviicola sp.]|uniref:sensor histidine kinase n=1 Tax=uncultured Fluviicola sp. TaxID=463303 RepID=UPI0025F6F006|nr:histidine kinase [uncultured Fluviicola sp.]